MLSCFYANSFSHFQNLYILYAFPLLIIFNYSFDNDDMKSSKRHECSFSIVNFLAEMFLYIVFFITDFNVKVAPYSFLSMRALISKISRWRKLSNSTPKSRAGSPSKMQTDMASKLLKFVYRKCCVDRLRFQNVCRLNRRPQLSLLDVKEKYTRHAGVSTNEAEFM